MTEPSKGRLYSARGVSHPEAIPAIGRETPSVKLPGTSTDRVPGMLSPTVNHLAVFAFTLAALFLDAKIGLNGWFGAIVFLIASLAGALLVKADEAWAGWTAPPIAFLLSTFITVFATTQITGKVGLSAAIAIAISLLNGLSRSLWAVLAATILCWFLAKRRAEVAQHL